jgi:DNA-binding transcriptional ArsR family regulator
VARRLGIAASSVSEHAAVLRRAGLVVSRRRSGSMIHTHTALGSRLVTDTARGTYPRDSARGNPRARISG